MHVKAEIITIGDEILYGQTTDTNSQWISAELDNIGVKTVRKTTIGDIEEDILKSFQEAEERADIILITGGLGPTQDDLTKPLLARYFDSEMEMHEEALGEIERLFAKSGFKMNELNRQQAVLPVKCEKITNKLGTAPGMWFNKGDKAFVAMPGVPYEMKKMVLDSIIPRIQEKFKTPVIYHKVVKTIGIGESWLAEKIKGWEDQLPEHIGLAYLPSLGQVKLRLTATGSDKDVLAADVDKEIEKLHDYASRYIFGYNNDTIEQKVGEMLRERELKVATAESCTGGYLAKMITSIPGSSDYFNGGIIPYHNDFKIRNLEVSPETLQEHGAVSEETVAEMAEHVRNKFSADIGVSTSGIAGPGGGTPEKPVGTVWIALADKNGTVTKKLSMGKMRNLNIELTALSVLDLVRQRLNEND